MSQTSQTDVCATRGLRPQPDFLLWDRGQLPAFPQRLRMTNSIMCQESNRGNVSLDSTYKEYQYSLRLFSQWSSIGSVHEPPALDHS
jgi:hypothetical protein